ncbi:fused MFS/spermidine synthase [bacterium]|nr:fused MFS/spermidine synthase [bacterium]
MNAVAARILVFGTSAAVLVLEIIAGRLMAPYVGVTLETFTGIIGVLLAGIAVGAWAGGGIADKRPARPLLGPILVVGGILTLLAPTIVHMIGPSMRAAGPAEIVILTAVAFFSPAAVLSTVPPMVVKLRLGSLDETGAVVGRLSALGTAGALFGTFATGFVLVAALPSSAVVWSVGGALIAAGAVLAYPFPTRLASVVLIPVLLAVALVGLVDGPCDTETAYYCASVEIDKARESGRTLRLDTLRHSYVDLDDPTHLEFRYAKIFADVISTMPDGPLAVLSIGGGGFTLPRALEVVRPGTTNTVLEIDGALVDLVRRELGLVDGEDLRIELGDARVNLREEESDAYDVVIGDAFGGLSVPWHLTTKEFVSEIADRLAPGGFYVLNLIDYPPLGFAKAEVATITDVFDHLVVIAPPDYLAADRGGNFVVVASQTPIARTDIAQLIRERGGAELVIDGAELSAFVGDARVLTDEFAPVDQLLSRP